MSNRRERRAAMSQARHGRPEALHELAKRDAVLLRASILTNPATNEQQKLAALRELDMGLRKAGIVL